MTELDREGNSDNFNFRGGGAPSFLQVCRKRLQATRKKMKCLHDAGSAIHLAKMPTHYF